MYVTLAQNEETRPSKKTRSTFVTPDVMRVKPPLRPQLSPHRDTTDAKQRLNQVGAVIAYATPGTFFRLGHHCSVARKTHGGVGGARIPYNISDAVS